MNTQPLYGLIASLIVLLLGLLKRSKRLNFEKNGIIVKGNISELVLEYRGQARAYYPIVNYKTLNNIEVEVKSSFGTYPPLFKKGQKVEIIYKAEEPTEFIIVNRKLLYIEYLLILTSLVGIIISLFFLF